MPVPISTHTHDVSATAKAMAREAFTKNQVRLRNGMSRSVTRTPVGLVVMRAPTIPGCHGALRRAIPHDAPSWDTWGTTDQETRC